MLCIKIEHKKVISSDKIRISIW